MMTTKMAIGAKEIVRSKHRLMHFIEQSLRMCSNQSFKAKQQQSQQQQPQQQMVKSRTDVDCHLSKIINTEFWNEVPEPLEHDADVGQQFQASQLSVRLATPEQLHPKPDNADELLFGKQFTDHMLKIYHHQSLGGWQKPQITPMENIVVHPAAKVLHYAVELFEGMKAYRGVDGKIRIFRPNMNMNRMNQAAKRSGLPTFEGVEFMKCLSRLISIDSEWVPHTEAASLYIRPTLIGIDPTLGVASSDSALLYAILSPVGSYFKCDSGAVSLFADPSFARSWPGGVGNRKMGSNYAPTIHIQKEAEQKGLHQVLWLYGEKHQMTEVGTMNIFVFFINDKGEKELRTPPLNGLILPGIVRDSILIMARQWGQFKVTEDIIEMPQFCELLQQGRILELFGTGTACLISPINRINYMGQDYYVPTLEQEKPVHEVIRDALMDIQYGKITHPWGVVID